MLPFKQEAFMFFSNEDTLLKSPLGLVYLDVANLNSIEKDCGRLCCENVLFEIAVALKAVEKEIPAFLGHMRVGDDFFAYFRLTSDQKNGIKQVEEYRKLLKVYVEKAIRNRLPGIGSIELHLGVSVLNQSLQHEELGKDLYHSMKQAIRNAMHHNQSDISKQHSEEFHRILQNQLIHSVYQPIVCLTTSTIFGHEALTRGPTGSPFASPLKLFDFAQQDGSLYFLDKLAREKAIQGSATMNPEQKLFINIPSHIMHHPEFTPGQTLKVLESVGLQPDHIVFEITERSSIEDFTTAKQVLEHYRRQGYQVAIDDAGAGYSSLQAIAEIQPDYIKVDRSLVHDIHKDRVKEYILETFVTFASKMNIRIIAEGIEQEADLEKLMRMGVHYAQGYLLGKPKPKLEHKLSPSLQTLISDIRETLSITVHGITIGDIVEEAKVFDHCTPCSVISDYFRSHGHAQGVVIVNHNRPVGLMMREKLFQQLAGQYGLPLYWNKSVRHVMDAKPLIVQAKSTLEEVSRAAMTRDLNKLYDLVIVTHHDSFIGVASIQSILDKLTKMRMEVARVSNPLTGLPGNVQIQRELNVRLNNHQRLNVIYVDLDYFKWYNDCYGFQKGDEMIQFTSEVLQRCVLQVGEKGDFIGHIGGDDFIIMSTSSTPELICEQIIEAFDAGVSSFYNGQVSSVVDRQGNHVDAKGVTISLSLIKCDCSDCTTSEQISIAAAKLKKQAKAYPGSTFVKHSLTVLEQFSETCYVSNNNNMDIAVSPN